jgi:predicted Ser/Thr protein kinase
MALSTGDKLGPYEILGLIGKGGMGEVYRARDPRLGRDVAVKVASEHFSERFEREARAIAALNHPNICAVYDVGPNYLVMELIEGPTLAERIAEGPLRVPEALAIATQVAEALEAAHDSGIVHRDLKPGNIKITPEGKVKVLDFGLAKIGGGAAVESSDNSPTISMHATKAGIILGTAAYMSPEQARGKSVDKRADIWSFGVVLYEMVTGRKLFAGEDLTETLASVVKEKADLSAAPPELHPLLEKCLEKDPRKRLRDISGVALLLDRNIAASRSAEQRAAAPSRSLVWGLGAIAALAISVAAVLAALWLRPSPLPKVTRFEVHAPAGSTLPYGTPAVSRDGRTLAYTETDSKGVTRIHLRPMDRVETRVLPGTEDAMHPFWSPDGQSLAFATLNMLKRIDIEGGSPHDLTRVSGPWHGDWNQFGEILFQAQNSIQRMSAQGSPPIQVQRGGFPVFLADGKRFLFRFDDKPGSSIRMATLDSPNSTPVVEGPFSAPLLAQAPNGKTYLMYLRPPDLFVQEFDEVSGVVRGQPKVLVRNIGVVANPLIRPAVGVSPSGILAYQTGRNTSNGQLQWIDRSGKKVGALSRENSGRFQSISPDGSHIAIEKPDADGAPQIWITDLTRGS